MRPVRMPDGALVEIGPLRLDNDVIVVADGGSLELRFYDTRGRHIQSVGGDGEGPGEFRVIGLLDRYGLDSRL